MKEKEVFKKKKNLKTGIQWFYIKKISSTQLYLVELIKKGQVTLPVGVWSECQISGIGTKGRKWLGECGNFFCSVAFYQSHFPPMPEQGYSIYFGKLVATLLNRLGVGVILKFPNDIYLPIKREKSPIVGNKKKQWEKSGENREREIWEREEWEENWTEQRREWKREVKEGKIGKVGGILTQIFRDKLTGKPILVVGIGLNTQKEVGEFPALNLSISNLQFLQQLEEVLKKPPRWEEILHKKGKI